MKTPERLPLPLFRAAVTIRRGLWHFGPLTFGAGVVVTDIDIKQILLIKPHGAYFEDVVWQIPGGGVDRPQKKAARARKAEGRYLHTLPSEFFEATARKELKEEAGIDATNRPLKHLFNHQSTERGNRDTFGIFHLQVDPEEVVLDRQRSEIKAIAWHDLRDLPPQNECASYLSKVASTLILSASGVAIDEINRYDPSVNF